MAESNSIKVEEDRVEGGDGGGADANGGMGGGFESPGQPGGFATIDTASNPLSDVQSGGGGGGSGASGGNGGYATSTATSGPAGGGGAGGLAGSTGNQFTNYQGGNGGRGAAGYTNIVNDETSPSISVASSGGGGGGGNGFEDISGTTIAVFTASGGNGGDGGSVEGGFSSFYNAGGGGAGGAGFAELGSNADIFILQSAAGGNGGRGGGGVGFPLGIPFVIGASGLPGDGGSGAFFVGQGSTLHAFGTVTGGAGATADSSLAGGRGGDGVSMYAGGTVINTVLIQGGVGAVSSTSTALTLNAPTAGIGGVGVAMYSSGTITNSGVIGGGDGGAGGPFTVGTGNVNGDGIGGKGGAGVIMSGGGALGNTGRIEGGQGGDAASGNIFSGSPGGSGGAGASLINVTLDNNGTISGGSGGTSEFGLTPFASATTASGGSGGVGLNFSGGLINNFGTIQGGDGGAVTIAGMVEPVGTPGKGGAGIVGDNMQIANDAGATIAAGAGSDGMITADAITFTGGANSLLLGGTINGAIGIGGNLVLGSTTFSPATLSNTLHDAPGVAGSLSLANLFSTGSTITLTGVNTYSGGTTISSGSTLILGGSAVYTGTGQLQAAAAGIGTIRFGDTNGSLGELELQSSAQRVGSTFSNTLSGFGVSGSALDLDAFTNGSVTYDSASMNMTVAGYSGTSGQAVTETFTLVDPAASTFAARSDGRGGTLIEAAVVCFVSGTRIRIVRGADIEDIAVEDLCAGDFVVTGANAHRPIRWLGHRLIDCRRHPRPHEVMPVRIAAHAFGPDRPARDLRVSPGHLLCVDVGGEVLIPAGTLINGTTIVQEDVDQVAYWHVELESHDILLAENMPAESYLDTGNRSFFAANGTERPDATPGTHADLCRPFHHRGSAVEAARAMLAARAERLGWRPDLDAGLHLLVDGKRVDPVGEGDTAVFLFSARARDVRLVSRTFVPATLGGKDMRTLGLRISGLCLSGSGGAPRRIDLDGPALSGAFHESERVNARSWRWTAAEATPLPPTLWSGLTGQVALHLTHAAATVRGYDRAAPLALARPANLRKLG